MIDKNSIILNKMRKKWYELLTLNGEEEIQNAIRLMFLKKVEQEALDYWISMKKSGFKYSVAHTPRELWEEYCTDRVSSELSLTMCHIRTMALAYRCKGQVLYKCEALQQAIIYALEWFFDQRYNETVNAIYDNWYDWHIGIPHALGDTLVLMYEVLEESQRTKLILTLETFNKDLKNVVSIYGTFIPMTGANLLDKALALALVGIVKSDTACLDKVNEVIQEVFLNVVNGDGFYEDGSFIQHHAIPYAGGYGFHLMDSLGKIILLTEGTPWQLSQDNRECIYNWVEQSFKPFYYKGIVMDMVSGRAITRKGTSDESRGQALLGCLGRLAEVFEDTKKMELLSFIRSQTKNEILEKYFMQLSLKDALDMSKIMKDETIPLSKSVIRHKIYGFMDRAVHHRPMYSLGISMYSSRVASFEYGNGENSEGWHTAHGAVYLYIGEGKQFTGHYWDTVDMMRLPGITTDHTAGQVVDWNKHFSQQDWVGGSVLEKTYGSIGMAFDTEKSSLKGKKSWFCFDEEIVCLGAGITSQDVHEVETIVENRQLEDRQNQKLIINGQLESLSSMRQEHYTNIRWVALKGSSEGDQVAYYFPQDTRMDLLIEERKSTRQDITKVYLSLSIPHGKRPQNKGYSYILLPGKKAEEVEAYTKNSIITILENNERLQAMKHKGLNIMGINFWEPETVEDIQACTPCSVTLQQTKHIITVGISDPTHLQKEVTILLKSQKYKTLLEQKNIKILYKKEGTYLTIDTRNSGGKTYTIYLKQIKESSV